ncbi:N-acetylmuramidase domain-containing protein [Mesorhizobium sp. SP-1A]|uniref:N-acetylmuramidase domain-containing protein n=1 Tax=Mesorhizobium sp. SP-1A TaxID=3077840 RepID=UPI0028F6DEF3|nr:N-acetylmuramidase domain-containing protein [Mesorhizobium sp. SP-1A]
MFSQDILNEIDEAARAANIEPAALLAVAELESGGRAHAVVNGRREPLIRFEAHYFDRRLDADKRAEAREQGLAAPVAGAVPNPKTQAARWRMLERAAAIDAKAAYESTSWGLGQVMGSHWAWLGYAGVDALVAEARSGVAGQIRLMLRYIDKAGLAQALRSRDWAAFARGYNGPGYERNGYDRKLAAAYARHAKGSERQDATPATPLLRRGSRGEAVRTLQDELGRAGHALSADGLFGPATEAAVRNFQSAHGLAADGIAGPQTLKALRSGSSKEKSDGTGLLALLLNRFSKLIIRRS